MDARPNPFAGLPPAGWGQARYRPLNVPTQRAPTLEQGHALHPMTHRMPQAPSFMPGQATASFTYGPPRRPFVPRTARFEDSTSLSDRLLRAGVKSQIPVKMTHADYEFLEAAPRISTYTILRAARLSDFRLPAIQGPTLRVPQNSNFRGPQLFDIQRDPSRNPSQMVLQNASAHVSPGSAAQARAPVITYHRGESFHELRVHFGNSRRANQIMTPPIPHHPAPRFFSAPLPPRPVLRPSLGMDGPRWNIGPSNLVLPPRELGRPWSGGSRSMHNTPPFFDAVGSSSFSNKRPRSDATTMNPAHSQQNYQPLNAGLACPTRSMGTPRRPHLRQSPTPARAVPQRAPWMTSAAPQDPLTFTGRISAIQASNREHAQTIHPSRSLDVQPLGTQNCTGRESRSMWSHCPNGLNSTPALRNPAGGSRVVQQPTPSNSHESPRSSDQKSMSIVSQDPLCQDVLESAPITPDSAISPSPHSSEGQRSAPRRSSPPSPHDNALDSSLFASQGPTSIVPGTITGRNDLKSQHPLRAEETTTAASPRLNSAGIESEEHERFPAAPLSASDSDFSDADSLSLGHSTSSGSPQSTHESDASSSGSQRQVSSVSHVDHQPILGESAEHSITSAKTPTQAYWAFEASHSENSPQTSTVPERYKSPDPPTCARRA